MRIDPTMTKAGFHGETFSGDLRGPCKVGNAGAAALVHALEKNTTLQKLFLYGKTNVSLVAFAFGGGSIRCASYFGHCLYR